MTEFRGFVPKFLPLYLPSSSGGGEGGGGQS